MYTEMIAQVLVLALVQTLSPVEAARIKQDYICSLTAQQLSPGLKPFSTRSKLDCVARCERHHGNGESSNTLLDVRLTVCSVEDQVLPYNCAISSHQCFFFETASHCRNGGRPNGQTCVCPPGFEGKHCQQRRNSCVGRYLSDPVRQSSEYTFPTSAGGTIAVYCDFRDGFGYTFFPASSIATMSGADILTFSQNPHQVIFRQLDKGVQRDSTIQQLTQDFSTPLTFLANAHDGFPGPVNTELGPYLFLGFLPSTRVYKNRRMGYKASGTEASYINCDGLQSNHFVFYSNTAGQTPSDNKHRPDKLDLFTWVGASSVPSTAYLPAAYFCVMEANFGGCGGYTISTKFVGHCSVESVAPGAVFYVL